MDDFRYTMGNPVRHVSAAARLLMDMPPDSRASHVDGVRDFAAEQGRYRVRGQLFCWYAWALTEEEVQRLEADGWQDVGWHPVYQGRSRLMRKGK